MKYSLGLDIGVTSIGWSVINEEKNRIEDLGVRIFEAAENPKNGSPLAEARREARAIRRRLGRRANRMLTLKNIFISQGLLTAEQIDTIYPTTKEQNPYILRVHALDNKISNKELYIILHSILKRRGYKSARKKVEETDKDTGPVLGKIRENTELLQKYRTVGEMFLKDPMFTQKLDARSVLIVRNKGGDYSHTILRSDLEKEIKLIFESQRKLGTILSSEFETQILFAFGYQKGFATGDQLKKMVGYCTFEKDEQRAAKSTHSFQLFVLLQRLAQLRIINENTGDRSLTQDEIDTILKFAYTHKEVNYKQVKKELRLLDTETFNLVRYNLRKKNKEGVEIIEDLEAKTKLGALSTYYELKNAKNKNLLDGQIVEGKSLVVSEKTWNRLFENNFENIDAFATVNTLYKTDEDVIENLKKEITGITDTEVEELSSFNYNGFGHLSLKAIRKINLELAKGLVYSDACKAVGYDFKGKGQDKSLKLTSFIIDHQRLGLQKREFDIISNPVVKRALSQCIKVVNAVIEKHGSPYYVKIEFARELGKTHKDRSDIEKKQNIGRENNEKIKKEVENLGVESPSGFDIVKYKLWKSQDCKCAYTQRPIYEEQLFGDNFVEVDHIIPYSRCGDDGSNNKVLVLKASNQDKLNRTPFEWFGDDEDRWANFEAFVNALQLPYKKKQNLLVKKYKNNDWNARALNDTRYITKYLKNHIENTLIFAGEDINIDYGTQEKTKESKQRVIVTNGITTAYLRKRWGLSKDRDESNLHHAMDATIVATVSPTLIKKITSFSKSREVMKYLQVHKQIDGLDPETGVVYDSETIELSKQMIVNYNQKTYKHFPEPWEGFANETRTRLNPKIADADEMRRYLKDKPGYAFSDMAFVKPVFVSRMPKRGVTGQAHKETLRSPRFFLQGQNKSSIRVQLTSLKQKDLENILGESKESVLYKELQARFAEYGDKAEVAFKEPIYRKDKAGNNVNIVRSIKVVDNSQNSGYVINQDKALVDNGGMSRVDIFTKDVEGRKKYYTVPVYSHQIAQKELPVRILPVPKKVGFINVDESFIFCFSVYPNDLLKIVGEAGDVTFGYYVKYNISSAGYSFIGHADTSRKDIDLISKSIGNAKIVEKYQVDVLGNYTKVKKEVRLGRIIKNKK